jgi:16S rRNA (guanine527-N7)-methyltransferase
MIKNLFKKYNFSLSDKQIEQFEIYFDFLVKENEKYNLTAITDKKEVFIKHFIDSVLPITEIKQNASVIDVGTGAGFPGVPLKILRPDIKLTLLDSLQKRINFLGELLTLLKINDVTLVHARCEDYVKDNREKFDVALSRAVAQLPTLSEYLLPFVKINGKVLMYKGNKLQEEIDLGKKAIEILGGKQDKILDFTLDEVESKRFVLVIENLPKTQPLL